MRINYLVFILVCFFCRLVCAHALARSHTFDTQPCTSLTTCSFYCRQIFYCSIGASSIDVYHSLSHSPSFICLAFAQCISFMMRQCHVKVHTRCTTNRSCDHSSFLATVLNFFSFSRFIFSLLFFFHFISVYILFFFGSLSFSFLFCIHRSVDGCASSCFMFAHS